MDWLLIVLGILMMLIGLLGAVLPVLPGPPISFLGLVVLHFSEKVEFSGIFLVIAGFVALLITVLDYYIPAWFTKKMKSSEEASRGALIGTIVGLFVLPPIGIIVMPIVGAFLGELLAGSSMKKAGAGALAGLLGIVSGIALKGVYGLWALATAVIKLL